ncbi:MAG: phosphate ABC transporter substrate-binding protein PstS [Sulfobacillus sp.]
MGLRIGRNGLFGVALVAVALVVAGCGASAPAPSTTGSSTGSGSTAAAKVTLQETGSTLLYPLFNIWAPAYHSSHPAISITTDGTGSGTGISQALAGTVQIGASDAYLSSQDVAQNPGAMDIPLAISAQVIAYNLPSVTVAHLKLSGPVLAAIYTGKITNWDSAQIAALNPGVSLPNLTITPLHRSDASGDTFIFSQYLSFTTPSWNSAVGYGTGITFPSVATALGEAGNSGMVTALNATKGAIAYVGISYSGSLATDHLAYAQLLNKSGQYVLPTPQTIDAAAAALVPQTPPSEALSLIYAPGANAYPLINYEYAIVTQQQASAQQAAAVKAFLTWALTSGNSPTYLNQVHFVPLPASIVQLSESQVAKIH